MCKDLNFKSPMCKDLKFKSPMCNESKSISPTYKNQNLNLPRAKISSDLSHRKDGRVMLKCSGSGVNSEKKHLQKTHVCMYSCTCSQCMCAPIVVLAANTDLRHPYVQRGGDSHRASKPHMQSGY